jgi:DNA replication and repair protein RecF
LSEYNKVLSQRNALLKQLQERGNDQGQLDFWDEKLARLGGQLIQARARAIAELEQLAAPIHAELTRGAEQLRLEYLPSLPPPEQQNGQLDLPIQSSLAWTQLDGETLTETLVQHLAQRRQEEIRRGVTLSGPHRDDLSLRVDGIDLRLYGSRGQNRTAMLAAKLAEVQWLRQRTGEWPVLLLDEVLAELDPTRREDLLRHVLSAPQAMLTTSDLSMFNQAFLGQCTLWEIRQGTLHRLSRPVEDA